MDFPSLRLYELLGVLVVGWLYGVCKVHRDATEEIIYAELKVPQKVQTHQPKDAREELTK